MIMTIAAPVIVFAVIILVHEGGHYVTAKLTGMRVEEFAVGFGPVLYSRTIGETKYSLRMIPLGGFNKIAGMDPGDPGTDPRSFSSKPAWARLLVISAGSLMNIILAFLIFWGAFLIVGIQSFPNQPVVGSVLDGSAASLAGIKPSDRILEIRGEPVNAWTDIQGRLTDQASRIVPVRIERDGKVMPLEVIPKDDGRGHAVIGITPYLEAEPVSIIQAASMAGERCLYIIRMMGEGIYYAVTGNASADVAGPLGVARLAGDVAGVGLLQFFLFIAVLSLNLGFLNFLPIPLLDGGLFFTILAETVSGRRMPEKMLYYLQVAGLSILVGLFLFATMKDISSFFR